MVPWRQNLEILGEIWTLEYKNLGEIWTPDLKRGSYEPRTGGDMSRGRYENAPKIRQNLFTFSFFITVREDEIDRMICRLQEQGYNTVTKLAVKGFNYISNMVMQTAIRVSSDSTKMDYLFVCFFPISVFYGTLCLKINKNVSFEFFQF